MRPRRAWRARTCGYGQEARHLPAGLVQLVPLAQGSYGCAATARHTGRYRGLRGQTLRIDDRFQRSAVRNRQYDDVDVKFRDANFQIKEIPNPDCRRSSEVRAAWDRAETAIQPEELFDIPNARDIEWVDAYPLILQSASDVRYPPTRRRKLDLLFYVTHEYAFLVQSVQPADLSSLGWRSISCLHGPASHVLVSASDAPSFLKVSLPRLQNP